MSELKLEKLTLLSVGNKLGFHTQSLENLKERLPEIPTKELVDGYVSIKDTGKKIDAVTTVVREEILTKRFEQADSVDEKGHRHFSGDFHDLKLEQRINKPKMDQEKAYVFFKEKGLLSRVADIEVSLSTEDIEQLIEAASKLGTKQSIWSGVFNKDTQYSAKELLESVLDKIQGKGKVFVNEAKVSALISLEELSVSEVEPLFTTTVTYAFKAK